MSATLPTQSESATRLRAANVRTAVSLGLIALVFFVGIIAADVLGGPLVAIGVVGTAVLVFLLTAIGRHLRK